MAQFTLRAAAFVALTSATVIIPAWGRPAMISSTHVVVDGVQFRVVRREGGFVEVVDGAVIGPGPSVTNRDRMRRAVREATGCNITDDFFLDGKLEGQTICAENAKHD